MEPAEIAQKLKLLLDSSGDKLKLEKGHPVKSTTESVRGKNLPLNSLCRREHLLTSLLDYCRYLLTVPHAVERSREHGQDSIVTISSTSTAMFIYLSSLLAIL